MLTVPDLMAAGRAGRWGAAQLVAVEVAGMGVAAAVYTLPAYAAGAAGIAALLLILPAVGRFGGRWWYEVVGAWLRLRQRRRVGTRAVRATRAAVPYGADLTALAPYLSLSTVIDRNVPIGVGADELGWFGAIALTPPDGLSRGDGAALRLERLARLVGGAASPASAVQLLVRQTPMPSAGVDPRSPSAQSYVELRDALRVPAHRDVWIAVRLGLRDAGAAVEERGGDGVHRAVAAALAQVSSLLTASGVEHRVLDGNDLHHALVGAYGPDPYDGRLSKAPVSARETWSRWRTPRAVHVSYAVAGWRADPAPDALSQLAQVPAAVAVCTAVAFGPVRAPGRDQGPLATRMLVRLVAPPDTVNIR